MKTFAIATAILMIASSVVAGPTTGGVAGVVRDGSGEPLPAVRVEVFGPASLGKRTTTTGEDGTWRVSRLTPGDGYEVVAAREGFRTARVTGIRVFLGADVSLAVQMEPSLEQEITVTSTTPLVETRGTTGGINITAEQIAIFPTTRDYQTLFNLAPGVSSSGTRRFPLAPQVGASTVAENDYVIDGFSVRDPVTSTGSTAMTINFIREVQVMTGGMSAEFGRSTGGVLNVVTKSGGNQFQGNVFGYFRDANWSSTRPTSYFRGTPDLTRRTDFNDFGGSLGGPLSRDRLWFFAAANPRRSRTLVYLAEPGPGVDPVEPDDLRTDVYSAKITFAPSGAHMLTLTGFGNPTHQQAFWGGSRYALETGLGESWSGDRVAALRYSGTIAERWFIEGMAGDLRSGYRAQARTEIGRTVPLQFDVPTRSARGGYGYREDTTRGRESASLKATARAARHEVRLGVDFEEDWQHQDYDYERFYYEGRRAVNAELGVRDVLLHQVQVGKGRSSSRRTAVFLQDEWQLAANLLLNLGVRYERQLLGSGKGVNVTSGQTSDGTLITRHQRDFELQDWAPRIGAVWDPGARGRSRVYAYFGRYIESVPLFVNALSFDNSGPSRFDSYYSAVPYTSADWWNASGSPLNANWIRYQTDEYYGDRIAVDAATKSQYMDEISAGADIHLGVSWSAGVRLITRNVKRVIEDHYVLHPEDPLKVAGYVIGNIGSGLASDWKKPSRSYRAAEFLLQRRTAGPWQLVTSFVYAQARGDYEGLFWTNQGQNWPNATGQFETPWLMNNSNGKLLADKPYTFKLHSGYRFPFGLTVSEGFEYAAGSPISAYGVNSRMRSCGNCLFITPRGSMGRLPDYWNLDLHAEYELPLLRNRGGRLGLVADVFNATNRRGVIKVDEMYMAAWLPGAAEWFRPENLDKYGNPKFSEQLPKSPWYRMPTRMQTPRVVQVGVKASF